MTRQAASMMPRRALVSGQLQQVRHVALCQSFRPSTALDTEVSVGLEYQVLGEATKVFNGGDGMQVIGSIEVGWSR